MSRTSTAATDFPSIAPDQSYYSDYAGQDDGHAFYDVSKYRRGCDWVRARYRHCSDEVRQLVCCVVC